MSHAINVLITQWKLRIIYSLRAELLSSGLVHSNFHIKDLMYCIARNFRGTLYFVEWPLKV